MLAVEKAQPPSHARQVQAGVCTVTVRTPYLFQVPQLVSREEKEREKDKKSTVKTNLALLHPDPTENDHEHEVSCFFSLFYGGSEGSARMIN
jgi:hypothetical protein